jgi:peptidoglycan hydrolase-like protein with peptidoglycan-binding domain
VSRKPAGKKAAARAQESDDGVMAVLIDRMFENPAMSGGLMVMALTASAIVSNAMFLQSGHHPDPLFMTRPAAVRHSQPAPAALTVPVPKPRPDVLAMDPPMPRLAPNRQVATLEEAAPDTPAMMPVPPETVAGPPGATLVMETQRELARLGLYSGTIDGLPGPQTQAAIRAYEAAAGLPRTGTATARLLEMMKHPIPAKGSQPASIDPAGDAEAAALDLREQQRAEKIAAEKQNAARLQARSDTRIIQGALNRIGYGPLPVDGDAGEATADAIRRFELDNGLPITGAPSDALVGRLVAIGAVKRGG